MGLEVEGYFLFVDGERMEINGKGNTSNALGSIQYTVHYLCLR